MSSVSTQAPRSHKTVFKHVINILTSCQLNPPPPFPFNDFLEVTLFALWTELENAMRALAWTQLSPLGKIDRLDCFALLSWCLTAPHCAGLAFDVIGKWYHLGLINFHWLCTTDSSSSYRPLDQNFFICRGLDGCKDWNELELKKCKFALLSVRCRTEKFNNELK